MTNHYQDVNLLFSAFNGFDIHDINPSAEALGYLPETSTVDALSLAIDTQVLNTCCVEAAEGLNELVRRREQKQFVLVMSGVAGDRPGLSLERFALNIRDYRIPDNGGHLFEDQQILAGAPQALKTKAPLGRIKALLKDEGLLADISNHAGTYLCNEIYYQALHNWQNDPDCLGLVFVHVPLPTNYVSTAREISNNLSALPVERDKSRHIDLLTPPLELFAKAFLLCAKEILRETDRQNNLASVAG